MGAVHGSLSRTRLSNFTFTFHFHALEKEMATHSSVLAHAFFGGRFTHAFLNKEWSVIKCSRNFYKARMGRVYHVSQQFVKL